MPSVDAIEMANRALVADSEEYKLLQYDKDGDGKLDEDEKALAKEQGGDILPWLAWFI